MHSWLCEYLEEMLNKAKVNIELDDITDLITEYANYIEEGVQEGYYASSNYVADCNLREDIKSKEQLKVKELKKEIQCLYNAAAVKGISMSYENGKVYEYGMEHTGGTIFASYKREIK